MLCLTELKPKPRSIIFTRYLVQSDHILDVQVIAMRIH